MGLSSCPSGRGPERIFLLEFDGEAPGGPALKQIDLTGAPCSDRIGGWMRLVGASDRLTSWSSEHLEQARG